MIFMCVSVLTACKSAHHMCAAPEKVRRGCDSLELEDHKSPRGSWKLSPGFGKGSSTGRKSCFCRFKQNRCFFIQSLRNPSNRFPGVVSASKTKSRALKGAFDLVCKMPLTVQTIASTHTSCSEPQHRGVFLGRQLKDMLVFCYFI